MRVECDQCKKIYTFKKEKLPPYGFSFRCKICDFRIQVSQAQLDEARAEGNSDKKTGGKLGKKLPKFSLPKFKTDKLKKPLLDAGGVVSRLLGRAEGDKMTFLAKYVSYFSIGLLFMVVLVGVFTWLSIGSGKAVTFSEVQRSLELKRDPLMEIQAAVPDIQLPGLIQKYIGDEFREDFVEWMNGLQKHQRKDFIVNLETIISQARSLDPEHVQDFIVEYQKLKSHRTAVSPFAGYLLKFGLIAVLLAVICLLGLFSLVLLEVKGQKSARPSAVRTPKRLRPKGKPSLVKSKNPR
ncbi:MAG: hypothetical protein AMJ54_01265 [Deltaproteobacteria bacterium SG8_13]|nr:MAG: hypothetical protein AMJ54_01265 [Deltaproteobacteria bacterium SG8_13]